MRLDNMGGRLKVPLLGGVIRGGLSPKNPNFYCKLATHAGQLPKSPKCGGWAVERVPF